MNLRSSGKRTVVIAAEATALWLTIGSGTAAAQEVCESPSVPTLGDWGKIALAGLLLAGSLLFLRRQGSEESRSDGAGDDGASRRHDGQRLAGLLLWALAPLFGSLGVAVWLQQPRSWIDLWPTFLVAAGVVQVAALWKTAGHLRTRLGNAARSVLSEDRPSQA